MIFQTRSCAAMKERQIFFLSKQNIFLTFSLKFMIVYDILCVSVFLHSTNDRHARTFYRKCISRFFVTQESLFKKIYGRAPKVYAAFVMLLISQAKGWRKENMFTQINNFISICNAVNLSGKRMEEREHVYTNQQLYQHL